MESQETSSLERLKVCHECLITKNIMAILERWSRANPFNLRIHAVSDFGAKISSKKALEYIRRERNFCIDVHALALDPHSSDTIQIHTMIGDTFMEWDLKPETLDLYQKSELCLCNNDECDLHYHGKDEEPTRWMEN